MIFQFYHYTLETKNNYSGNTVCPMVKHIHPELNYLIEPPTKYFINFSGI